MAKITGQYINEFSMTFQKQCKVLNCYEIWFGQVKTLEERMEINSKDWCCQWHEYLTPQKNGDESE